MKLLYLRQMLLLVVLLLTAQLGWSQGATTAAMSGTITDNKGGVLPGATVIAVHTPTNTQYVAPTNADGRFNIQNMRVGGPYTVRVTFVGFQDYSRSGINLTLAENFRLDAKLGESTTQLNEVTVTGGQNPVINADRTGAQTTIQRQQIERLPTLNRSFNDFTRLTPQGSGTNTQSFAGRNNLYNNLTIDGAIFNNAFGLSSTIGGQAGAQPVSLDAIDQIQVSLAPYDVRQGSFTGAGINAVTRSGTNKLSVSVYDYYRNQDYVGQKVGNFQAPYPNFKLNNVGFRIGGPIIKDKLFFFVNAEMEKRTDPPSGNYTATRTGVTSGPQTSQANAADLDALGNFLVKQYGYNPGAYENYGLRSNSYKATAKLDWNINNNNHFNIKYNYLKSYSDVNPSSSGGSIGGSRAETVNGLPFFSSYYTINNNLNSIIAELNSNLGGGKFSNNITAGYIGNRDYREYPAGGSPFPMVDIGNQVGLTTAASTRSGVAASNGLTTFGSELYSAFNVLNSDIYQFGDNFTAFLGKHNVTVGTYNELYKFSNGYAPNYYGTYQYNSLEDFYASAGFNYDRTNHAVGSPYTGAPVGAARYALQYSTQANFPYAVTKAAQLGFYVQDEYTPINNLKITLGLRGDIPIIFSNIDRNVAVSGTETSGTGAGAGALTFRDGIQFSTSQLPQRKLLFSPRIGFNWDVNDDKKTQVRGGTGIFTGRVPFVWISNQAGNNGVQFNSIDVSGAGATGATYLNSAGVRVPYTFNPSVDAYRPTAGSGSTSYSLAVTDRNFKFPQVWRSNLAVDQVLPGGIVATIEGLYTKDINAMFIQNIDLPNTTLRAAPVGITGTGGDQRPIFYATNAAGVITTTKNNRIFNPAKPTVANPAVTDAELLTNTKLGYSYSVTGQLQKSFSNGIFASVAYTYADSRSVNDGSSSVAYSNWSARAVSGDPNENVLGYSQWLTQHRVIASLSYRHEYLDHLATTFSMFYDGEPTGRYSYVYNGDMNGDNVSNNDLMYIPRTQSEINLAQISTTVNGGPVLYTAAQQWTDLDKFISQDPYLSKHRGEYAQRNGASYPWQHRVDVKVIQDIFTNIGENRNTLQFSVDIFNIGNLLNRNWGAFPTTFKTNPLNYIGYNAANQPIFSYGYYTNPTAAAPAGTTLTDSFRANTGSISSRWQLQVGLRYLFN